MSIDELRGERRVVILFAPRDDDDALRTQGQRLETARDGLVEREVAVVVITRDGGRVGSESRLGAQEARALRSRFDVGDDRFVLVLVGKDGTEKARREHPVDAAWIFETIDAMPMRRREMAERRATRGAPTSGASR